MKKEKTMAKKKGIRVAREVTAAPVKDAEQKSKKSKETYIEKKCSNCRSFDREIPGKSGGFCLRYPPIGRPKQISYFPLAHQDWVCGEHTFK